MAPTRPAIRIWPLALIAAVLVAGCDSVSDTSSEPSPRTSTSTQRVAEPSAPPDAPVCPPTAQYTSSDLEGVGDGATLWAMLFSQRPTAGDELKVAWRMTGTGDLSISATGPDGKVVKPVWGPEQHTGSSWKRPGSEWGTGWIFPTPGCWTINATRTTGKGTLMLRVGE